MIDSHAHFNSKKLFNLQSEIERVNNSNLTSLINVGLDLETSKEVIDIGNNNTKFYSAIGVHPTYEGKLIDILNLYDRSDTRKIVAIGETGLDYDESKISLKDQKEKFIDSIIIANTLKLPLIIHANNTNEEVMNIIKIYKPKHGFVFHCFQPDLEILKEIMLLDGYISVGTPITRPTAKKSLQVIKEVLLNHLLIELDYPFMSNEPFEQGKSVFNRIKEIRGLSFNELETILDNNTKRIFKKIN